MDYGSAAGSLRPTPPALQRRLFCRCGAPADYRAGLCRRCYHAVQHSRRYFGGQRELVLERDRRQCRICGSRATAVHHRQPGIQKPDLLLAVCAACHARLHRLRAMDRYLPPALVPLWAEQHPGTPLQQQMEFQTLGAGES